MTSQTVKARFQQELQNRIVYDKALPLHAHYSFYYDHEKQQPAQPVLETVSSSSTLANNPRVLNCPNSNRENKSTIVKKKKAGEKSNKPAFGCSQPRKSIVDQNQQTHSRMRPGPGSYDVGRCSMKNQGSQIEQSTKVGFGVGSSLLRSELPSSIKRTPGPGQYNPFQSPKSKLNSAAKIKILHSREHPLLEKSLSSAQSKLSNNTTLISTQSATRIMNRTLIENTQPGPGSYNIMADYGKIYHLEIKKKWKQKLEQKRLKKLEMLSMKSQAVLTFEESRKKNKQKSIGHNPNNYKSYLTETEKPQYTSFKSQSTKNKSSTAIEPIRPLLRNQLREITEKFLPKIPEIIPSPSSNGQNSLCQYLTSNSFMPKNDHAYQAHYYVPMEKDGDYILIKGRESKMKLEMKSELQKNKESYIFASKLERGQQRGLWG